MAADVDTDNDWSLMAAVVSATVVVALLVMARALQFKLKHKSPAPNINGIDILRALRNTRLFPVEHAQGWMLSDFVHEQRIWSRLVNMDPMRSPVMVHASFTKVKGSPQTVQNCLVDVRHQQDWDLSLPRLTRHTVLTKDNQESLPSSKLRPNSVNPTPVHHDVIGIESDEDSTPLTLLTAVVRGLVCLLQRRPISDYVKVLQRFWHKEENGCCWLLEYDKETQEWTFYLMQPIDGWFETDRCMVTILCNIPHVRKLMTQRVHPAALKLGSLRDHFVYRKVQCAPLVKLTSPSTADLVSTTDIEHFSFSADPKQIITSSPLPTSGYSGLRSAASLSDEVIKPRSSSDNLNNSTEIVEENSVWKKIKTLIDEKKEWYEREKQKRSSVTSSGGSKVDVAQILWQGPLTAAFSKSPATMPKSSIRARRRPEESKAGEDEVGATRRMVLSDRQLTTKSTREGVVTSERPKNTVQAARGRSLALCDDDVSTAQQVAATRRHTVTLTTAEAGDIACRPADVKTAAEMIAASSATSENGEGTPAQRDATGDEFQLDADVTAAEIQAEKLKVASLDITSSYKEQAKKTDGWIYCGLEKEIVILRKIFEDGNPTQSYMGKGIIPCSPKMVFELLKSPGTRTVYDDMLKKVDIIHEFANGMKIVYLQHEISQMFKKESRDFCVLQSERIENAKYVITLQSIQWPACPDTENIVRARMLSSGWIIEPVMKDDKLYSMVTYIAQMELGSNKANTGYLVEDLAAKQPLCIAYLRQYLSGPSMPSVKPVPQVNSTATGPVPIKKRTPATTLARLAEAAERLNDQ